MNRRTTLITAAAVTGTLLAGAAAVSANIGILDASTEDNLGELTVTETTPSTVPTSMQAQVIDIYVEDPVASSATADSVAPAATGDVTTYTVDDAGTVAIEQTSSGLWLDRVVPADGWRWTSARPSPSSLTVTFTRDDTTFVFHAEIDADGTVVARVDQPVIEVVQRPAAATGSVSDEYDDEDEDDEHEDDEDDEYEDDEDDEYEDDEDEDDEDEDDEYEDDEYEGGDDDD